MRYHRRPRHHAGRGAVVGCGTVAATTGRGWRICGSTDSWIQRSVDPSRPGLIATFPWPSHAVALLRTRRRMSKDLWIHESVHGATTSGEAQDGATTARRCHDDTEMSLELWTQGSVDPWICGSTDLLIHKSVDGATTPGGGQDDATTARRRQDSAATFF